MNTELTLHPLMCRVFAFYYQHFSARKFPSLSILCTMTVRYNFRFTSRPILVST